MLDETLDRGKNRFGNLNRSRTTAEIGLKRIPDWTCARADDRLAEGYPITELASYLAFLHVVSGKFLQDLQRISLRTPPPLPDS